MRPTVIGIKKNARWRVKNEDVSSIHALGIRPDRSRANRNSMPTRLPGSGRCSAAATRYPALLIPIRRASCAPTMSNFFRAWRGGRLLKAMGWALLFSRWCKKSVETLSSVGFEVCLEQKSRRIIRAGLHHEPTRGAQDEMLPFGKFVVLRIVLTGDPESAGKAGHPNGFPLDAEACHRIWREPELLGSKFTHPPSSPAMH